MDKKDTSVMSSRLSIKRFTTFKQLDYNNDPKIKKDEAREAFTNSFGFKNLNFAISFNKFEANEMNRPKWP